jgi:hypothetical protein
MKHLLALLCSAMIAAPAFSATLPISGPLLLVDTDGTGIYSGTPLGTIFSGSIDDEAFNGVITDGVTETSFGCCIAAGGISIDNDVLLDANFAGLLNFVAGEDSFAPGMMIDLVDIEGDTQTSGLGRLEVGVSYVLHSDAFPNDDPSNYPFMAQDVLLGVYFILEEDAELGIVYDGLGRNEAIIPVPAAAGLFASALGLLGWFRRRAG